MSKRIAVLTGGGDVPGLNPCIKAIVYRAVDRGYEVIGIRRGWAGLVYIDPADPSSFAHNTLSLTKETVRKIDRSGGTFLHTSRMNPSNTPLSSLPLFMKRENAKEPPRHRDLTSHVLTVIDRLGVDALLPIGGDDTLSYAHRMHQEGVPVLAIPKTMDNDVFGTDYCIGFSTAITRSVDFITQLRTSIGSHERIGVVELFGRNSGETSLITAYLSGVDRAIISEVPFDLDRLCGLLLEDRETSPSHYAVMTISEGASLLGGSLLEHGEADAFGHRKLGGIGYQTAQEIRRRTGVNIVYQQLGYLMRSGVPDSLDRMVGTNFGTLAVDLVEKGERGRLLVLQEGRYGHEPLEIITQGLKRVDVDTFYDLDNYRPKVADVMGKPMFLY